MLNRKIKRISRQRRIRAVVRGSASRPRLAVYRSGTALFVQIIDDEAGRTLVSKRSIGKNMAMGVKMGKDIAALAMKHTITSVVFDRGGNRYHGVIKAFADAAREGGLKF
ncbi:MAG: 50S ribosomal protein L18 [Candidatus Gottesmanbacteria bacterium]|nr:50S ribosomal protein L18 [Candidatus Gottesmanbacteria bacterium]